jgi:SpoVK/Ycf46/Vps4 family AAA+-type ATPase
MNNSDNDDNTWRQFDINDNSTNILPTPNYYDDFMNHNNTIQQQISEMWNFIAYKDFVNENVKNLQNILKFKDDTINSKDELLIKKNNTIEAQKETINKKTDEIKAHKKDKHKMTTDRTISTKYVPYSTIIRGKKSKKYKNITKEQVPIELLKVFESLNNIEDIINLENHKNKWDLLKNEKYVKLVNLIPNLKEINGLIGMDRVKKTLFKHICFFIHDLQNNEELLHVCITGHPGVGKTLVATMIAKIYLSLGFLKNDTIVKARRSDLIGEYLGQTAVKTQKRIDEAEGGVLLIDEAYSLGNKEKRDSFSKECIDTLNQNLTEKKGSFLCIIIGYKEHLHSCFFAYNPGLERRFTIRFELDNYKFNELSQIFKLKIKNDDWKLDEIDKVEDFFEKNMDFFPNFGGDVEVFINNCKYEYSLRMMKQCIDSTAKNRLLLKDDLENGFKEYKGHKAKEPELPSFIKHLYN